MHPPLSSQSKLLSYRIRNFKVRLKKALQSLEDQCMKITLTSLVKAARISGPTLIRHKELRHFAKDLVTESHKRRLIEVKKVLKMRNEQVTRKALLKESGISNSLQKLCSKELVEFLKTLIK